MDELSAQRYLGNGKEVVLYVQLGELSKLGSPNEVEFEGNSSRFSCCSNVDWWSWLYMVSMTFSCY